MAVLLVEAGLLQNNCVCGCGRLDEAYGLSLECLVAAQAWFDLDDPEQLERAVQFLTKGVA